MAKKDRQNDRGTGMKEDRQRYCTHGQKGTDLATEGQE
jgi:hypothetical protein